MITYEPMAPNVVAPRYATDLAGACDVYAHLTDGTGGRPVQFRTCTNQPFVMHALNSPMFPEQWTVTVPPGYRCLVPTGFKAQLPEDRVALLFVRSGHAWKHDVVLANAVGVIDADYPDEWMILLRNASREAFEIRHGDRIAQILLVPRLREPWVPGVVTPVADRTGGFGSTGSTG